MFSLYVSLFKICLALLTEWQIKKTWTWDACIWISVSFKFCLFRTDKYEGKPIYWVEEDIEVEFTKTASRSQAESSSYQVAGSLADVMADASHGVSLSMQDVAGGKLTGLSLPFPKLNWVEPPWYQTPSMLFCLHVGHDRHCTHIMWSPIKCLGVINKTDVNLYDVVSQCFSYIAHNLY